MLSKVLLGSLCCLAGVAWHWLWWSTCCREENVQEGNELAWFGAESLYLYLYLGNISSVHTGCIYQAKELALSLQWYYSTFSVCEQWSSNCFFHCSKCFSFWSYTGWKITSRMQSSFWCECIAVTGECPARTPGECGSRVLCAAGAVEAEAGPKLEWTECTVGVGAAFTVACTVLTYWFKWGCAHSKNWSKSLI